jgi:hypothetical protein
MRALRALRIAAIALGLFWVFDLSRRATAARYPGETVPGIPVALAIVALILLASAVVTERREGPESDLRKDLLWGLATGCIAVAVSRLW